MISVLLFFLLLFSSAEAAPQCSFQTVNNRQVCVCTDGGSFQIVDDSYCSSDCPCSFSQAWNDFTNAVKQTPIFNFLSGFSLNVSGTPPPPIPVHLPPFVDTTIDIASNPLMLLLLQTLKVAWTLFGTILAYFIIFRR